jgi:biopolymer transport protein ExbB/TolQ
VQWVFVCILAIFAFTYGKTGHRAARTISYSEHAVDMLNRNIPLIGQSDVRECLAEAIVRRERGFAKGQTDFGTLFELTREKIRDRLMTDVDRIENVRTLMFFIGLFCTIIGIIQGFALQLLPTNPEESKVYAFTIIKALGLAYLPGAGCIGSALLFHVLGIMLQTRASALLSRFDDVLYSVILLEEGTELIPLSHRLPASGALGGSEHALAS